MTMVTAYDSLGEDGLKHSLLQTHSSAIFLDPVLLPTLDRILKDAADIKYVIYDTATEVKQEHIDSLKSSFPHIHILSFEDLRKLGEENPVDPVPPSPEDLCKYPTWYLMLLHLLTGCVTSSRRYNVYIRINWTPERRCFET